MLPRRAPRAYSCRCQPQTWIDSSGLAQHGDGDDEDVQHQAEGEDEDEDEDEDEEEEEQEEGEGGADGAGGSRCEMGSMAVPYMCVYTRRDVLFTSDVMM